MRSRGHDWLLLALLPLAKLAIHLATFPGYGYFRDEFYYLACSRHLDFGYVDHPPLSILLLWLVRSLLGESLLALRLLPALAGAATVLLVGLMARDLGGGRRAQALAMTAAIAAPYYLAIVHFYSMNAFDVLFWALAAWVLIRLCRGDGFRWWVLLGIVLGLGLQNKISVLWLGFGLAVGLVATDRRRWLLTPGPWVAAGLAALLFLPHVLWQIAWDWPTAEFIANATSNKMAGKGVAQFLWEQVRLMNPMTLPVWLAGLGLLLFGQRGKPFRMLGWIFLAVLALLALSGTSRAGYLAPAYTWLLAAGGVAIAGWLQSRWALGAALALLVVSGAVMAPLALPVLPVPAYIEYSQALGIQPRTEERKELAELPQFYADMHGWEQIADTVRQAYRTLEPPEREQAVVLAPNYGVAGALELLAPELPAVVSAHNSYWLWGPRGKSGEVMIVVGSSREELEEHFAEVELAGRTDCGYCMPYENDNPVWIGRRPFRPLTEVWPRIKHYD